jgi:hypothetical protein
VDIWRSRRYDGVTPTTRRLLEHWADGERDNRILFAQREAAETAILGRSDVHELDELRDVREQADVYEVARVLVEKHLSTADDPRPWYFPQAVGIVRDWMRRDLPPRHLPGAAPAEREHTHHAAERVWDEVIR